MEKYKWYMELFMILNEIFVFNLSMKRKTLVLKETVIMNIHGKDSMLTKTCLNQVQWINSALQLHASNLKHVFDTLTVRIS